MSDAHLVEPLSQHVAQEGDLGVGGAIVGRQDPVEVLDLEDGVGQDLRGTVVDVLGHALALAFLGLDDPQPHRRRRVVRHRPGLVARRVGGVEVAPQQIELAGHHVEPLQAALEGGELSATLLVLGAQRIGPDRSKRTATAIEPCAELHPLVQAPAVLLAELLGERMDPTRVAAEAVRGLGADPVELLAAGLRGRFVLHGFP